MEYKRDINTSKLEFQPYFHPPKYAQECAKENRTGLYGNKFPQQDCFIDPYYPERKKIFHKILSEYKKNNPDTLGFDKENWKKSLQKVYRELKVKTPYNYYDAFFKNILQILNANGNSLSLAYSLYKYVDTEYNIHFIPDPFHAFFSILDFCIYELFTNKHTTLESTVKFKISNENLVKFLELLIVNGYIGITQFRFILYFSILYRNEIYINIINLINKLDTPLSKILSNKKININIYKRLLLEDSLEFAYTQFNFNMVKYLIEELHVPYNSISPRIVEGFKRKEISEYQRNKLSDSDLIVYDKYYS
jgi:hypothetical protein